MIRTRAALAAVLLSAGSFIAGPIIQPLPARIAADRFGLSGPLEQGGLVAGRVPSGTTRLSLDQKPIPFDAAGRFIIGLDRDQQSTALLAAQLGNGTWIQQWLRIAPRAWQIEHIDQDRPSTGPTPEYQKIRDGELARIAAARAFDSGSTGWKRHFIRPAQGRISGVFGSQRIYRGGVPAAFHSGLVPAAGQRAVAIPVTPSQAIGGAIVAGARVDVIAVPVAGRAPAGRITEIVAANATVLDVRGENGGPFLLPTPARAGAASVDRLGSVVIALAPLDEVRVADRVATSTFILVFIPVPE